MTVKTSNKVSSVYQERIANYISENSDCFDNIIFRSLEDYGLDKDIAIHCRKPTVNDIDNYIDKAYRDNFKSIVIYL